jgi:hypothetical protein
MLFVAPPLVLLREVSSLHFTASSQSRSCASSPLRCWFARSSAGVLRGTDGPEACDTTFTQFFRGLTIMAYAFSNQTVVFPVYLEMHTRTAANLLEVSLWTSAVSFSIYGVAG